MIISAFFAQLMIMKSLSMKKPSYLMPLGYITVILSFCADFFIFNANLDLYAVIGILLTSGGLLTNLWSDN
jgi:drug/metabolite transporter (DMT)-like permease